MRRPALLGGICTSMLVLLICAPRAASAYPTSVVFAPSGEALPFGSIGGALFGTMSLSPPPVALGVVEGGVTLGVVPSFDMVKTRGGTLSFGGGELGFDIGAGANGAPILSFNFKLQLFAEGKYWPATSVGFFQIATDGDSNTSLGYFVASKAIEIRETYLGQLTFGMMRSFADRGRVAPQCVTLGSGRCVFRGSNPFEDLNTAFLAGYFSPWFGPFAFGIDYVGGTSDVSSANLSLNLRVWHDERGGFAVFGLGGFLANDRRDSPPGPGAVDGVFAQFAFALSLTHYLKIDPTKEWARPPRQHGGRGVRPGPEDPFEDAPPLKPPEPTDPAKPPQ